MHDSQDFYPKMDSFRENDTLWVVAFEAGHVLKTTDDVS
jgi:hypothetical protein